MNNPRALIRGQKAHRNLKYHYSFWRPLNWQQARLPEQHGVIYYPETDFRTGFYVTVTELDGDFGAITPADLPTLREGLLEGLAALPDCRILAADAITKEQASGFDFLLTFTLDGVPCKRRMRLLYLGGRQYTLYGQGVPPEDYDVFANVFDYIYLTFHFGDVLLDTGVPPMPGNDIPFIPAGDEE